MNEREYVIVKLFEGGYVVGQRGVIGDAGMFIYGAAEIDDALKFIKGKLAPKQNPKHSRE